MYKDTVKELQQQVTGADQKAAQAATDFEQLTAANETLKVFAAPLLSQLKLPGVAFNLLCIL